MSGGPSFEIPVRPERRFPFGGGVEYEGSTTFVLRPTSEHGDLPGLVADLLAAGPYRYGDFRNLPMPLYLVKDTETGDVFRLSVRDGSLRLHALPATGATGLRALYDRLDDRTTTAWRVDCRTG